MNNQEQTLALFRDYAREVIIVRTNSIREEYNTKQLASDLRLKIFNQHVDELRQQLLLKVRELSMLYSNQEGGDGRLLATRLNTLCNNYINEFYKSEF